MSANGTCLALMLSFREKETGWLVMGRLGGPGKLEAGPANHGYAHMPKYTTIGFPRMH